ncbi:hypothetical protein [Halorubrum sp. CSM-61]|uniref:hypothetical protein n=1 Tax=Halorubrum sp. CSM-61 TaxID=2485838 RepID=UPI000F4BCB0F|nr:hypothetical protein [Halorubrum sp. CSM-61]
MSLLGDAVQTLNEDIEIAAFLPGVNYVFLLIASGDGLNLFFWLTLAASIISAALFNHLRSLASNKDSGTEGTGEEVSDEWDDPRDDQLDNSLQITQRGASILLFLPWVVLLAVSMYFLLERFSKDWVLPEILFFVSVGFISLYLTDIILKYCVSDHTE